MKIAFLGTPDFALPSLKMLMDEKHSLLVFTQPDKPQGRHARLTPPPVKSFALEHGIAVCQPEKIKSEEGLLKLREFAPDLMVTAAFGQILSEENLLVPRHGCINVHGSLLPKYRGAAPIQWAVINGEKVTGITTMMTDVGLDTGDILLQSEIEILPDETAGELYNKMAALGADVLKKTIELLEQGKLTRTPQDHKLATKCGMLKKETGKIDFSLEAKSIHNLVRGVNPWPGAYALLDDAPIKIWRTRITQNPLPPQSQPGLLFGNPKTGLFACCADGALEILELQFQGGKRMEATAALRGRPLEGRVLK
ncbi:methionyl-tRNA formyltransferase [Eubacteriales bacterium OttesenSCG-928-K08]|nr:methionyl-tRNA formyltransferase [Eubacteriales bacterium OttesenSCG-928-K08]